MSEQLLTKVIEQMRRVRAGELPLHIAAAELGMMPFELEQMEELALQRVKQKPDGKKE